jgi:short-subunit dehydrogenase
MSDSPVILITGASSGIGAATARLFGSQGYRVVLAARRADHLEDLADDIVLNGGFAQPIPTDVTQIDQINRLVESTIGQFHQIDVLFNNAGVGRFRWLEELDPVVDIEDQLKVNLNGVIQITRTVLPHMIERRKGHIVNMSSIAGYIGTPSYSVYAATKFGIRGFTEALRREVGIYGVLVSGVYPGGVLTEFMRYTGTKRKTSITTPKFLRLTADQVSKAILRVVVKGKHEMIIPWPMRIGIWLNILFPRLVDWVIEQRFTKRERA